MAAMFKQRVSQSRVKAAIIESKLKRSDIAKKIGISDVSLRDKLNGHSSFTLKDMLVIKEMTNKPFEYFLEDY